jgi:hypothetical protein
VFFGHHGERGIEIVRPSDFARLKHDLQSTTRALRFSPRERVRGIGGIPKDRDAGEPGNDLLEQSYASGVERQSWLTRASPSRSPRWRLRRCSP